MPRRLLKSILLCVAASALLATPASAATFVVDTEVDEPDAKPGDGFCDRGSGTERCSLRAAIMEV